MQSIIIVFKSIILSVILLFSISSSAQMQKKTLYLIPGQGSDYRIYKHFKFDDFDTVHVKYIIPHDNETMKSYAQRLSEQIDTTNRFSIIGVSLGGMLAVELSEFLNPEEVIIISSAKNRNDLPFRYKFMQKVPLNTIFGGGFLRAVAPTAQIIVEPDSRKERELCVSMLNNKNELFMKRSVNMIVNWERENNQTKITHIHGNNDHTIPIRNVNNVTFKVKNGSHMMVLTQGETIRNIVCRLIKR